MRLWGVTSRLEVFLAARQRNKWPTEMVRSIFGGGIGGGKSIPYRYAVSWHTDKMQPRKWENICFKGLSYRHWNKDIPSHLKPDGVLSKKGRLKFKFATVTPFLMRYLQTIMVWCPDSVGEIGCDHGCGRCEDRQPWFTSLSKVMWKRRGWMYSWHVTINNKYWQEDRKQYH